MAGTARCYHSEISTNPAPIARNGHGQTDVSTAVLVSELFPPAVGGSAVLLGNIYTRLGARTRVIVLADRGRAGDAPASDAIGLRVEHQPIVSTLRGIMARGSIRHHARLALRVRDLCRERPVVVHAARALPEGLGALGCRIMTGVPYVCWCHGEEVATARTSRELTFMMRRVYRHASAVIANSHHTAALLSDLGVAPGKVVVVHPGVDADRFSPTVDGSGMRHRLAPDADLILLSVGRLQRRKGHDLVIKAVAELVRDQPGLRYVIVGDGDERASLEALAAALGIGRQVIFAGELPDADLPACYAACDLFVMPNRIDGQDLEGFGIVFLEAAASGKPSIGGASGGVPEAIAEGVTGFLVSGVSPEELADRIRLLGSSSDLRARLGDAGRARVLRDFTWERAATAIAALHGRLAA